MDENHRIFMEQWIVNIKKYQTIIGILKGYLGLNNIHCDECAQVLMFYEVSEIRPVN